MVLKDDWVTGESFGADDQNAAATQVNTNTSDITGKADASAIPDALTDLDTTVTGSQLNSLKTKVDGVEEDADVTDAGNVGSSIHGATAKTTPVDADELPLIDSAASNALKKLTWANLKATAKTYFDTLYVAIGGALGTPSSGTLTNCTFPTLNQNTTGSAATLTTARTVRTNLASTSTASFNGSANITPGVTGTLAVGNGGTGAATLTGVLKGNGTGAFTAATAGTDYYAPGSTDVAVADGGTGVSTLTGIVKGNGTSAFTAATAGTDYLTPSATQTVTATRVTPRVSTTTSSATPTINTDTVDMYGLTAQTANITSFTTNLTGTPSNGDKLWIYVKGTGARTIAWGAKFEAGAVALPTTTTGTERLDVGFVWNAVSSKWRCCASGSAA